MCFWLFVIPSTIWRPVGQATLGYYYSIELLLYGPETKLFTREQRQFLLSREWVWYIQHRVFNCDIHLCHFLTQKGKSFFIMVAACNDDVVTSATEAIDLIVPLWIRRPSHLEQWSDVERPVLPQWWRPTTILEQRHGAWFNLAECRYFCLHRGLSSLNGGHHHAEYSH